MFARLTLAAVVTTGSLSFGYGQTGGDSSALATLVRVTPAYPDAARATHAEGKVIVRIVVSESGEVLDAKLLSGDAVFGESALHAAKQWKFEPYLKNGTPTKIAGRLTFHFTDKRPPVADASGTTTSTPSELRLYTADEHRKPSGLCTGGKPLNRVLPEYRDNAKSSGVQGVLTFHAYLDESGKVVDVLPVSGPAMLIPPSLAAIKQWRFEPFVCEGHPARVEETIYMNYGL